jgi:hypothetical protein
MEAHLRWLAGIGDVHDPQATLPIGGVGVAPGDHHGRGRLQGRSYRARVSGIADVQDQEAGPQCPVGYVGIGLPRAG